MFRYRLHLQQLDVWARLGKRTTAVNTVWAGRLRRWRAGAPPPPPCHACLAACQAQGASFKDVKVVCLPLRVRWQPVKWAMWPTRNLAWAGLTSPRPTIRWHMINNQCLSGTCGPNNTGNRNPSTMQRPKAWPPLRTHPSPSHELEHLYYFLATRPRDRRRSRSRLCTSVGD